MENQNFKNKITRGPLRAEYFQHQLGVESGLPFSQTSISVVLYKESQDDKYISHTSKLKSYDI